MLAGNTAEVAFRAEGHDYRLVLSEPSPLWDLETIADQLPLLMKAHQDFWKNTPFEREYLILNAFIGSYSGLEHDHSTLLFTSRWMVRNTQDYYKWLGLVSQARLA